MFRHQKKVLALVLAFACAFTMFAGAAFTDAADIKAGTAVEMLSALGVIDGYADGSFKPEGTVTRAEMAKMIYVVRNQGNDNADSWKSGTTKFTDLGQAEWAMGYIKYCEAQKIIAGKTPTTFKPNDLVTGTEAAKMLLVCAGYQADKAGLTGAGWDQKTLALASENGLLDDMGATNFAAGLPRQYAAQVIYNALDMDTVEWNADANAFKKVETTGTKWEENPNKAGDWAMVTITKNETVGKKWMKLDTIEGVVIDDVSKEDGKSTYSINGIYKKVVNDYSNLMGQKVKVMIKDNDNSKVYGVYADDDSKVVASGYMNDLETVSSSEVNKVKMNGTEYKTDKAIDATAKGKFLPVSAFNQSYTTDTNGALTSDTLKKMITAATDVSKKSASVKLIDNDGNGKIDNVIVTPVTVKEVTYVGTASITAGKSYKFDDGEIYDGVKKDDWAVIVDGDNTSSGDFIITKAETVTGKVTGIKTKEVKIDGTWYDFTNIDFTSGSTYECAVVGNLIVDAEETSDNGVKSVLYLSAKSKDGVDVDLGESEGTLEAKAYFTDGSSKTIKISKYNTAKLKDGDDANISEQQMYTYSTNSSGQYEIKDIKSGNMAGYDAIVSNATKGWADKKINNYALADDSVVFAQITTSGKETVKVLSGKTVKDWNTDEGKKFKKSVVLLDEKNGINYAMVAALVSSDATAVPGSSSDYYYGYVIEAYTATYEGDNAVYVKFWDGNTLQEKYVDSSTLDSRLDAGKTFAYSIDGKYIKLETVKSDKVAITGFDHKKKGELNYLTADTSMGKITTLDDDCVFIGVDTGASKDDNKPSGGDIDAVSLAQEEVIGGVSKAYQNAVVYTADSKIVAIVYDVTGKWDGASAYAKANLNNHTTVTLTDAVVKGTASDATLNVKYGTKQNEVFKKNDTVTSIKMSGGSDVAATALTDGQKIVVSYQDGTSMTYTIKLATKLGAATKGADADAVAYAEGSPKQNDWVIAGDTVKLTVTPTAGKLKITVTEAKTQAAETSVTATEVAATEVTVTVGTVTDADFVLTAACTVAN